MSLRPYLLRFGLYYALAILLVAVLDQVFGFDGGSGGSVVMLLTAAFVTSMKFVNDNKRAPDTAEKVKLSLGSLVISWLMSGAGLGLALLVADEETAGAYREMLEIPAATWALIAVVLSLVYYLLLRFAYGWAARKHAAKL